MPTLSVLEVVIADMLVFEPSAVNKGVSVVGKSVGVKVDVSVVVNSVAVKADVAVRTLPSLPRTLALCSVDVDIN